MRRQISPVYSDFSGRCLRDNRRKAECRDTVESVLEVLRRHVSERHLRRIVPDLLDVPGNASFGEMTRRMASTLEGPE
jgi:hypothetical protein